MKELSPIQKSICQRALCGGWETVEDLLSTHAGQYRVGHLWDNWCDQELEIGDDEVECPVESPEPIRTFSGEHPECELLLFPDRSLYNANNGEDEVWADAQDFCTDCGLERLEEEYPDSDAHRLAQYLGLYS